jgi:hypothetical protein
VTTLEAPRRAVDLDKQCCRGRRCRRHRSHAGRPAKRHSSASTRPAAKTQRFLALVTERYGPLAEFPITNVSKVCSQLAPEVDLNTGAARTALRRNVQAAQNGSLS